MKELKDHDRNLIEEGLYHHVNSLTRICFMSFDSAGLIIERPEGNKEVYFFDIFASKITGDYLPVLDTDIKEIMKQGNNITTKFIESKSKKQLMHKAYLSSQNYD